MPLWYIKGIMGTAVCIVPMSSSPQQHSVRRKGHMKIRKGAFNKRCLQFQLPTVGDARDDWKIIRALSEVAGVRLPYDSLGAIRSRIRTVAPNLVHMDEREPATFSASLKPDVSRKMSLTAFGSAIENFYMTDSITRASKIMAQCSASLLKK